MATSGRGHVIHSTKLSDEKKKQICLARSAVKEGRMTMYKAARQYNIPLPTLWRWCEVYDNDGELPAVGRPCFLGTKLESKLKQWILEAAQCC